jgi:ABC-type nitrate/sulfonate/bicarbonate transport system permease component
MPGQVVLGIVELMQQGLLLKHVLGSLLRVTLGYLLAAALAIPLGILLGWFGGAYVACNPLIQLLRPISPIAWIPVAILWFGVGDSSPIFLIFLSSFFPMVVETTTGVHTIERQYLWAAQNFGACGLKLWCVVIFLAALPQIIIGMRVGLGSSLVGRGGHGHDVSADDGNSYTPGGNCGGQRTALACHITEFIAPYVISTLSFLHVCFIKGTYGCLVHL